MTATRSHPAPALSADAGLEGQHLGRLRLLAAVQAALLPALGIPCFFRNEASWHYTLWQKTPFFRLFDGFMTSESGMSNAVVSRPLVRIVEWVQVRLFGLHASWYVAVNGLFFVLFALALFALGLRIAGAGAAVLAVLLLVGGYMIVFYPVLNAIHGVQYPLEMFLCTASLCCFLDAFRGRTRRAGLGIVLALLACVCHAASAIVIPLAVAAMWLGRPGMSLPRRLGAAALTATGVGIAFLLERQGVAGGVTSQPDLAAKGAFAWAQLNAMGGLVLKPPGGPLLLWGLAAGALALYAPFAGRPGRLALASGAVAIVLLVLARSAPASALVATAALIVAAAVRARHLFLAVWAATGVLLFLATPEKNASYMRHFVVPVVLLASPPLVHLLATLVAPLPRLRALATRAGVFKLSLAATLALLVAVGAAARFPVPVLGPRIQQVRYVGDLGIAFRDVLTRALAEVPNGGTLGFLAGRSRDDEMRSLYGEDYFQRLQPAKTDHYDDFVALMGRPDVQVQIVDAESAATLPPVRLVAVNGWELDRLREMTGRDPEERVERGRARAGIWRVTTP